MAPATPSDETDPKTAHHNHDIGPHPSFIQVAKPYIFEQRLQQCMKATATDEAREDAVRLQGVLWIDAVRRAMQMPVKTFYQAVIYYHRFRLVHAEGEYVNIDAAAAALFAAAKIEDTLKKSKDVLCAAYNLKVPLAEQLSPDDAVFEEPSRRLVGLERLMLEASGFDFRCRDPSRMVIKFGRMGRFPDVEHTVGKLAFQICNDLYRTYAPLKQASTTMAIACIELAARLLQANVDRFRDVVGDAERMRDRWGTGRAEIMGIL